MFASFTVFFHSIVPLITWFDFIDVYVWSGALLGHYQAKQISDPLCIWQSLDLCNMSADSRPFENASKIICTPTHTPVLPLLSNTAAELTLKCVHVNAFVAHNTAVEYLWGMSIFASRVYKWKITDWCYTLLQSIFHPCISRTAPVDLINNGSTVIHEMPPRSPSSLLLTAHLQPHCRRAYTQLSHRLKRLSEHFSLTAAYSSVKPWWFFRLSGVMFTSECALISYL